MINCDCDFCDARSYSSNFYPCKVFNSLEGRVKELEDAIKYHAAQKLDDRCWLDDLKLYKLVGIDTHPGLGLQEGEFISNCKRYWKCQQTGEEYKTDYPSVDYPWNHE